METSKKEFYELIANRVPPGDRWALVGSSEIYNSLTEVLEAWFDKTGEKAEFKLNPIGGKAYVIRTEEVEIKPVAPKKFKTTIDRLGRMVDEGKLKRVQISSSLDGWGPQQEYVRWGLDLKEWQENFEYCLTKPFVQQCINAAINPLTIKTMPDLIRRMTAWQESIPGVWNEHYKTMERKQLSYSFMTVMAPNYMDPAIFGAGVFDKDFEEILALMPENTDSEKSAKHHMEGISKQIAAAPRNTAVINGLKDYLTEIDRRRGTSWPELFPWLDQDWK
jgi:hypothetical protein